MSRAARSTGLDIPVVRVPPAHDTRLAELQRDYLGLATSQDVGTCVAVGVSGLVAPNGLLDSSTPVYLHVCRDEDLLGAGLRIVASLERTLGTATHPLHHLSLRAIDGRRLCRVGLTTLWPDTPPHRPRMTVLMSRHGALVLPELMAAHPAIALVDADSAHVMRRNIAALKHMAGRIHGVHAPWDAARTHMVDIPF